MTTKNFSATDLPHPRYSLELGRFSIKLKARDGELRERPQKQILDNGTGTSSAHDKGGDGDINLPSTCLPRFSQLAQVIEVKRPGLTLPGRVGSNIRDFLGSYCVIENARPELFLRRDFISKFVDNGTIHISSLSDHQESTFEPMRLPTINGSCGSDDNAANIAVDDIGIANSRAKTYKLATKNNVMTITMGAKQYHRFGLVAKKVISLSQAGPRKKANRRIVKNDGDQLYVVEICLLEEKLKKSNKYQDKLIAALRRLNPVNKVYFRFIPDKSKLDITETAANELSLEFFNNVIKEYELDGCKPVPLTNCSIDGQKVERNWVNYSQLHPELCLINMVARIGPLMSNPRSIENYLDSLALEEADMAMAQLVEIIDWLGYQVLELDCDKLSKTFDWNDTSSDERLDRLDVSCTRIIGHIDFKQVQDNMTRLFVLDNPGDLVLRALILYDASSSSLESLNSGEDLENVDGSIDSCPCANSSTRSGVIYLQDCSSGSKAASEIMVISMSGLD